MASEMRRAAKALVESTPVTFVTPLDRDTADQRLRAEIASANRIEGQVAGELLRLWEPGRSQGIGAARFEGRWGVSGGEPALVGVFLPSSRLQPVLRALSVLLALLVGGSLLVLFGIDGVRPVTRFLLPLTTAFAILAFPILILALASQKLAAEARIARVVRACLSPNQD